MNRQLGTFFIVLFALSAICRAETNVSGSIGTTTWAIAGSPFHVTDTLTVTSGNTLTIEPGVDILFDAGVPMIVYGAIHAVGTAIDSIRFLPDQNEWWGGLRIYSQNNDSSTLHYVRLSKGESHGLSWEDPDYYGGCLCIGTWRSVEGRDRTGLPITPDDLIVPPFPESSVRAGLDHIVVTGGLGMQGGGVAFQFATVTMQNSIVHGNVAIERGAGLYVNASRVTVQNSEFTGNVIPDSVSSGYGGGVRLWDSHVLMEDCIITGNSVPDWGGGIHAKLVPDVTLRRCVISGNKALNGGGVSVGKQSVMTLESCEIHNNTATTYAGGFFAENHSPWVYPRRTRIFMEDCSIHDNAANQNTGAYLINCDVDMTECSISCNTAESIGAGVVGYHCDLVMSRCTVDRNTAQTECGGLYAYVESNFQLTNCIVAENQAPFFSAYCIAADNTLELNNCIVWGNTDGAVGESGTVTVEYSDVEGDNIPSGAGNISVDPLFTDPANGDFTLQGASPCINAGNPALTDPDGSRSDMGAIWYDGPVSVESYRPFTFTLSQNMPNPFNPATTIPYTVATAGPVSLNIYNLHGQLVKTLVQESAVPGEYHATWNGRDMAGRAVASGVYVYRLNAPDGVRTKRMLLVR